MTEVLQSPSPSHFPSPSSSSPSCVLVNDASNTLINTNTNSNSGSSIVSVEDRAQQEREEIEEDERKQRDGEGDQLSLLTLLVAVFRKSLIGCTISGSKDLCAMEIGLPTNVRHVAHVTFDRFNGFLGLPVEFEPEVPRRAPSASANVFGVSTESMQLSFDARGNSVPTILLLMQRHLYAQGGLQVEGIFRLTADNSQEEFVRDQLNRGVVPDNVDVHCLAGLIKAWFRELPTGVLDSLSPEQVMQSQSEEECTQLVRLLPSTEAALLDWAVNLMADVAQLEHLNRMNARNVAMVFAPNMTQMADPLTALMYAVQVMNFLKTLIVKTLREREDSVIETSPASHVEPSSDEDGHQSSSQPVVREADESTEEEEQLESHSHPTEDDSTTGNRSVNFLSSIENIIPGGNCCVVDSCPWDALPQVDTTLSSGAVEDDGLSCPFDGGVQRGITKNRAGQSSNRNVKKGASKKVKEQLTVKTTGPLSIVGRLNSRTELAEAWR